MANTRPRLQPNRPAGRFSIRHLILTTTMFGIWFGLLDLAPHLAILVSGVGLAIYTTYWWLVIRESSHHLLFRLLIVLLVPTAWIYLYIVSIGPARVLRETEREDMIAIFVPVGWLHAHTPLREPLQQYSELWN